MKLASLDRSMSLSIAAPGMGFTLKLVGHVWLFDKDSRIVGSFPPDEPLNHLPMSTPERCPGCSGFVLRDWPGKDGVL
jgi:hypothetical protein